MKRTEANPRAAEWLALHGDQGAYERLALAMKLLAVLVWLIAPGGLPAGRATLAIALLWGQEAIWRTWQQRLFERLLALESASVEPFRLYSDWARRRGGMGALLGDYARGAMRPTVVYPYGPLLLLEAARPWWS